MGSVPDSLGPVAERSLILAGPTGVGKSELAVAIAERVGAEVVSADSRQLYKGMSIGTAAPTARQRARVAHHGIDLLDPGERVSAGRGYRIVAGAIAAISSRGHPSIVVAGSTLYVEALVRGLSDVPGVPPDIEAELERIAQTEVGARKLYEELRSADPAAAKTLDATKTQRLVRYVGALRATGQPPSSYWERMSLPAIPHHLVILTRPRKELYERIERRVDRMVQEGLVDEAHALWASGPETYRTLSATIGYRELLPVFSGDQSLSQAIALIKRNTRRYAKRQLTWYRRYPDAHWLDARSASAEAVLAITAPWPDADEEGRQPDQRQ